MKKRIDLAKAKSGFTMVELSITLAFIGVLLITIAVITTNIVTIYQKGMALKAVNSVGRGLIDDFISSVDSAPSVDTISMCRSLLHSTTNDDDFKKAVGECVADHAYKFIYHEYRTVPDAKGESQQLSGIFCTGSYSYIWNTYYGIDQGRTIGLKYKIVGEVTDEPHFLPEEGSKEPLRLARFKDPNYRLCSATVNDSNYEYIDEPGYKSVDENDEEADKIAYIDITNLHVDADNNKSTSYSIAAEPTQGMLNSFDLDLFLYDLKIFPISQDSVSLRTYMAGTFILATGRGNVDILRSGDYCQPGIYNEKGELEGDTGSLNNLGSEFNYCAINKFNFAGRTAGV